MKSLLGNICYRTARVLYGIARGFSRTATRLTTWGEKLHGTHYDDEIPF